MNKTDYIAQERAAGKTISQIIAEQPTVDAVGAIRGDNLRNVVDILAKGLQDRIDLAEPSPVRTALIVVFRYLGLENYQINLAIKENADLLSDAVAVGLVTPTERDQFFALATYKKPLYDITQADFVGEWHEIAPTDGRLFTLNLNARTPEPTYILIQMQDLSGAWEHATALHGVQSAKPYRCDLPYYGQSRALRWACAYALNGQVAVV